MINLPQSKCNHVGNVGGAISGEIICSFETSLRHRCRVPWAVYDDILMSTIKVSHTMCLLEKPSNSHNFRSCINVYYNVVELNCMNELAQSSIQAK